MTGQQRVSRPIIRRHDKNRGKEKDFALPRWANDRVGCQGREILLCRVLTWPAFRCDACRVTVSAVGFSIFQFFFFFSLFFFFGRDSDAI